MKRVNEVTRVYKSHHFDSTIWDEFVPSEGDVVITTSYKAGTTWTQRCVQVILAAAGKASEEDSLDEVSPWVDLRFPARAQKVEMLRSLTTPRYLKSHLPADGIPVYDGVKYILVCRDGPDVFFSWLNHWRHFNDAAYDMLNSEGLEGPPYPRFDVTFEELGGERGLFERWITRGWDQQPWEVDGWPCWSATHHLRTWWPLRHRDNVLFLHFNNLKADLEGSMRKVARFLGVSDAIPEDAWPGLAAKCTFDAMKRDAEKYAPAQGALWEPSAAQAPLGQSGASRTGGQIFINKGENGRWRGVFTQEQVERHHATVREQCGADAQRWLETGEMPP
ncbi:unnamed protein product [Pedinophyceae sp. YPF-701]|nr:unnamed protein product [Pedinophyceae sp. YPF-701]